MQINWWRRTICLPMFSKSLQHAPFSKPFLASTYSATWQQFHKGLNTMRNLLPKVPYAESNHGSRFKTVVLPLNYMAPTSKTHIKGVKYENHPTIKSRKLAPRDLNPHPVNAKCQKHVDRASITPVPPT